MILSSAVEVSWRAGSCHVVHVCCSLLRPYHAPWLLVPLESALSQEVGQTQAGINLSSLTTWSSVVTP